ncbi:MAG: serine/threonine-protein kinase [Myxococcota bacterium]
MDPAPLAASPAVLPVGARLDRYQIIRRLKKGGMAELYIARQLAAEGYEKIVAIKRVLPHLAEDATFVRMFLNEARLAAGLSHGNIAQVLDFGSEGNEHYLVLEYVHGRSVHELLGEAGKHGGLPLPCALTIVREVAAALHYAHEKAGPDGRPLGLVHRDVSPSNVLVSYDGEVKLVDFGIAKATAHTRVTQSGTIKGKLAYMAPEQVRGEAIDRRADVFSLAVVAYELCTGRRCFVAPGEFALINRVAEGRYTKPSSVRPDFPAALEAIIVRGLAVKADERYESAQAMQMALEEFAESQGHRLSKLVLTEAMHGLFGTVAYPTSQALPSITPVVVEGSATVPITVRAPPPAVSGSVERPTRRGRAMVVVAGSALVIGLGLGIGLPRLLADDAAASTSSEPGEPGEPGEPDIATDQGDAARASEPGAPSQLDPAPSSREPDEIIDDAALGDPAASGESPASNPNANEGAEPSAEPAASPRGPRRRSSRKKPRKRTKTASDPSTSHEYLPPSRRSG